MLQDRSGGTPAFLAQQAQQLIAALAKRPEIERAYTPYRATVPQIYADIDREKVKKLGIPLSDLNTALGAFLGGAYVNDFNRFGRLYKVYVQAEPEYRTKAQDIGSFYVRNSQGEMIPLSTLVKTENINGPEYTNRFNLFRAAEISGSPAKGFSSAQALKALEETAKKVLPNETSYEWNAMSFQEKEAEGKGAAVFVMALVFVFLI